ncbi:twin-arginine translocase TatA/TatE family subunit [Sinomonas terrae]|uniref:Twin-arginine translocase TatA/TatE family subunit n=1 Tax=Sinomonas terrae TaxID=2908838 RepID=A0ABS9U6J8_9MICC|nr:twin-arginine translocase TatA/TatE family subunit [Sinomonas terrae]MCH6472326.1 twin-arginine translocase TatA/TatE family subunit [Sinomonas terrae]
MARLFEEPWVIGIIILAALLLFGAPKLPGIARSVGQSLRIFKTEVKQFKEEASPADITASMRTAEPQD